MIRGISQTDTFGKISVMIKRITVFVCVHIALISIKNADAQFVNIPDANFRTWLNNNGYASCMNGNLMDTTCALIVNATKVNCQSSNIANITGIQYFDNLDTLICTANQITFLPPIHASLLYLKTSSNNSLASIANFPPSLLYIDLQINSNVSYITSLPPLPPGLLHFNCYGLKFHTLPALPSTLTYLACGDNPLYTLPALPAGLTFLDCLLDSLTSLTTLPSTLTYLNCGYNQLTSLPSLPSTLNSLYCYNNQLTFLPALPSSLSYLWIANNSISSLPALPPNLFDFNCSHNNFSGLPVLPNSVSKLDCSYNQLTSLPSYSTFLMELNCDNNLLTSLPAGFPSFFDELTCSRNQLTSLPALNSGLNILDCSHNPLTAYPVLPTGLTIFTCDSVQLPALPSMPSSLDRLSCIYCPVSSLPVLPDTLLYLNISNTPLNCLPEIMRINYLQWTGTPLNCLPNIVQITTANPSVSSLGLCQPSGNCPTYWNITGNVFKDVNANCIKDVSEDPLKIIPVKLDSAGIFVQEFLTNDVGDFSFRGGYGNYTVRIDTSSLPYNVTCPVSFSYSTTLSAANPYDSLADFGLQCKPGFDLEAKSISHDGMLRPGAQRTLYLKAGDAATVFGSFCAAGISGSVQAILTGPVNYAGPAAGAVAPSFVSGDTITWVVNDFSLSNPDTDFNIEVSVPTSAVIGDTICIDLSLAPSLGDNNPANNILSNCIPIVNSFDPNAKYMSPSGDVDTSQQWFDFTIFFQNTGNAPAGDIYILDTLSNHLDASTFTFLSSSHDVTIQLLPGYVLRFNYPDINLPDSVNNEPASHGYVQFKLKRKGGLLPGTVISNKAAIYFDFNPAISTNMVSATLTLPAGISEINTHPLIISPNPSHGEVVISNINFTFEKAELFDVFGKEILQLPLTPQHGLAIRLNISSLSPGIYFLTLSGKQDRFVGKIVKE